ncbi:MAG: hypothetical protein GY940_08460, partial [bacterium]|nr:hypothetical protein [bacterium]
VTLTLSTGGFTTTGSGGLYSVDVPCGTEVTITPTKPGWTFTPPSIYYESVDGDSAGEDYVGTASGIEHTISGLVSDESGRTGMDGVTVEFSDGHITSTSGGGNYSYTVPDGWTGTASAVFTGFTFTPALASLGPISSDTTQNFAGSPIKSTISGIVMDDNFDPINGVTMTISGGGTFITALDGTFSFNVGYGWSGWIRPSKWGWTFEPVRFNYSNVISDRSNQFFIGVHKSNRVTISGTVQQSDGAGISVVTLTFTGGEGTATTDDTGFYSKTVISNWSGTVTPAKTGYTFSPTSRTYSNIKSDLGNQDYTHFNPSATDPEISLSPT